MQCSISHLKSSLTARKMRVSNENIVQKLTLVQAIDARDALAKSIYARLFDWLVEQINLSLQVGKRRTGRSISILDIYGFESFHKNSFEQFCINYANERLQQHFNRHLFKLEQEEYIKDGIDWTRVEFEDNQECLNLFENKPLGLLSLLNEESTFPNGTDLTFANKLKQHLSSNGCFRGDRGETFGVRHYAGEVMYDSSGFLEKNRDLLHLDSIELLSSCLSKLPKAFAEQMLDQSGKVLGQQNRSVGAEFQKLSVATKFKAQLFRLMQRLEKTTPHFIRCIKPNNRQLPGIYEQDLVLQQLRCCGVLEVVRISRSGYPTRISHQKFARRYGFLLLDNIAAQDPLTVSVSILNQFNILPDMYQVGFTKLFFRTGQIGVLEDTRNRTLHAILGVQKLFRGHRARRHFKELKKRAIMLQSIIRGEMSRREYEALIQKHRAARVLQHYLKQSIARKRFLMMRSASVLIQSGIRGWLVRRNSSVPIVHKSNRSVDKLQVVDADHILVRVSEMQELQERVVRAEAELREKEEENDILRQRLHQYETRWSGYEIKMKSMEETWQKQMTSLRSSLTTAKRSLANDTSNRVSDASSTHAGENEDELVQWNSFSYAERRMGGSRSLCFDREMSTGLSVINQLAKVLEQRTQVFDDDVKFLEEVKSGKAVAELDVDDELKKLKRDFKLWKKEFSTSLRKTKTVLQKLGSEDGQDRIKKRWWSKRGNSSRTLA